MAVYFDKCTCSGQCCCWFSADFLHRCMQVMSLSSLVFVSDAAACRIRFQFDIWLQLKRNGCHSTVQVQPEHLPQQPATAATTVQP